MVWGSSRHQGKVWASGHFFWCFFFRLLFSCFFWSGKFLLCPLSVGLLLQATIGGVARDFSVLQLGPRVFCFSVSSKVVGFHIFKLVSFECSCYKVFFHLWGNGGPRWDLELAAFNREEADS